jgi:HlyD family secretion protein
VKDLDTVAVDQVVGTISGVGIEESSNAAQARYEQALRDYEMTRASEAATISDLRAERTRAELRKSEREAYYQKRLQAFKAGDISRRDVDAVKREVDSIQSEITALTDRIRGREGAIQRAATAVEQQRIDLQKEQATTQDVTQVKSTVAGRVVDLKVRKGDTVRKGDVIADVETGDEQAALKVVAFVSSQVGKSISPRDPVQITVAGIRREEYGFLRGTVESVSEYMVSPERVAEVMKEQATKQSSYEVWIVAEVDPKTVSGYAWSNGDGPPERITSGTQATVAIEVDQRAPISQLIPYIKSIFGG